MKKIALIGFAFATLTGSAQAVTLFEIVSANTDTTGSIAQSVNSSVSGVTVYTRGSGIEFNSGGTFNSKGWDDGTSAASAVAAGNFVTWGFTAASGKQFDLTDMSVRYDRSNTGPALGVIQLSVNGGSFVDVLTDNDINVNGEDILGVNLASFGNVTSATFRFVGWGATAAAGTFDFENAVTINGASFQLNGTVESVPEPASMIVLAAAGMAVAARRKRK